MTTETPEKEEQPKPVTALPYESPSALLWRAGSLTYSKAGLRMLFFWLLWGDFTIMLRERSVGPTFQYMLKQLHASDFVLGLLVTFIPQAIAMVLGPVISYRSDRFRGPRGRRIPYLMLSTPLCFVGMVGLAMSPKLGALAHPAFAKIWGVITFGAAAPLTATASVLVMVAICWTIFEIFAIVTATIFNALIADVVPSGVIGRFFGLFRMVSLADGMFFSLVLIRHAETHYTEIFLAVGALFAVSFGLMCLKVKEGEYPPPATTTTLGSKPRSFLAAVRIFFRECFTHPYYRWLTLSIALTFMAFTPINTFSIAFSKALGMSPKVYGFYSTGQFAISFCQAYIVGMLVDKFHPIRLVIVGLCLHSLTVLLAFFLIRGQTSFGVFHVIAGSCAGFWGTAYAPFLPTVLPRAKYATFASAIGVASAVGMMVIGPACGWFLDNLVHNQYRYIYLWCLVFDLLALMSTLVVYRMFKELGGTRNYVAPEV